MRRGAAARTALLLGALLLGGAAAAYVPGADQIANEVAKMNRAAGRAAPLELRVDLRMGDVDAVLATGTLVSDPRGASRLELKSPRGTWERHLRRGSDLEVSRLGEPVERPRPFLPPFYLLQAASAAQLRGGLVDLGARSSEVALGYQGPRDCWVLGGRSPGSPADRAALWIDQETLEAVRLDLGGGVSFLLGPPKQFGKLQVPAWIDIRVADGHLARLDVRGARQARPAPGSFASPWLSAAPPASPE